MHNWESPPSSVNYWIVDLRLQFQEKDLLSANYGLNDKHINAATVIISKYVPGAVKSLCPEIDCFTGRLNAFSQFQWALGIIASQRRSCIPL